MDEEKDGLLFLVDPFFLGLLSFSIPSYLQAKRKKIPKIEVVSAVGFLPFSLVQPPARSRFLSFLSSRLTVKVSSFLLTNRQGRRRSRNSISFFSSAILAAVISLFVPLAARKQENDGWRIRDLLSFSAATAWP